MSIEWFDVDSVTGQMVHREDPSMTVIGIPDYVRLPPDLGGAQVRVKSGFVGPCPCRRHETRHLELDNGMFVARCPDRGFLWYQPSPSPDGQQKGKQT